MLYPTKAPCWIHWLLRAVCAHPGHLCSETAIFFIYLLIIYPACPAKGKKSDDSTCTSHRFFFLLSEDASRAERSRVSEILRLLQKALPPDMFSFDGKREPENHQRFRRAGPTNHGLLALDNPKEERLHTKNPNRFARGFFVFRRFRVATRRAVRISLSSICCATAAG